MERDMDLVRELLLEIESDPKLDGTERFQEGTAAGFDIAGHSDLEVGYHLIILMEGGLVAGKMTTPPLVTRLTWQGHEFLDTFRDGETWKLTKESAKRGSTFCSLSGVV